MDTPLEKTIIGRMLSTTTRGLVVTPIEFHDDPLDFWPVFREQPFPFLLESALPSRPYGCHSFMGSNPFAVIVAHRNAVDLYREGRYLPWKGNPFDILHEWLEEFHIPNDGAVPFPGGCIGFFGYDLAHFMEALPRRAANDLPWPEMVLAFYDQYLWIDHQNRLAYLVEVNDPPRKRALSLSRYRSWRCAQEGPLAKSTLKEVNFTRERYLSAIRRAQAYILKGDIYQVNISQRFAAITPYAPLDIYRRLRKTSPASYSTYLELGPWILIGSSPEQYLRVEGTKVRTRPIKGTRRRGETEEEDERLRSELYGSPKDDAELAMIVDLERNDLGRACMYGSVRVTEPKVLETHPTVHHLSATVEGTLRDDVGPVELLRCTFPSGSVTGAPKIRAMEIIDELEPTRRATYTGAIGWIGFDGNLDLSMAIRIILAARGPSGTKVWFQAGGAIVADSDPASEYEETLIKARGILHALRLHP